MRRRVSTFPRQSKNQKAGIDHEKVTLSGSNCRRIQRNSLDDGGSRGPASDSYQPYSPDRILVEVTPVGLEELEDSGALASNPRTCQNSCESAVPSNSSSASPADSSPSYSAATGPLTTSVRLCGNVRDHLVLTPLVLQ